MNDNQKWLFERRNQNHQNYCPVHHNTQPIYQNQYTKSSNSNSYYTIQKVTQNQYNQEPRILPATTIQSRRIIVNQQYVPVSNPNNYQNRGFITNNEYNNYQKNQYYNQEYNQSYNNYSYNNNVIPQYKKIEKTEIIPEADGIVRNYTNNYSFYVSKGTSAKSVTNLKYKNNSNDYRNTKPLSNYGTNQIYQTTYTERNLNNNNNNYSRNVRKYSYSNNNNYTDYNNNYYSENENIYRNNRSNIYTNNNYYERNKPTTTIITQNRVIQPAYEQARYIKKLIETDEQVPSYQRGYYSETDPYNNNKNYISERKNYYHRYYSNEPNDNNVQYNNYEEQNDDDDIREYEGPDMYDNEQRINIDKVNTGNYNNFNFNNKRYSHSENKNINRYKNNNNNYYIQEKETYYESPSFQKRYTEIITPTSRYSNKNRQPHRKYNVSTENPSLHYNRIAEYEVPYEKGSKTVTKNKNSNREYTTFEKNLRNIRELDFGETGNEGMRVSTTNSNNHSFYVSQGFSGKNKKYKTSTMQQAYRANKYILRNEDGSNDNENYDYYSKNITTKPQKYYNQKNEEMNEQNNNNKYQIKKIPINKNNQIENNEYIVENIVTDEIQKPEEEYYDEEKQIENGEEEELEEEGVQYDPTQLMASKEDNFGFISQSPREHDDIVNTNNQENDEKNAEMQIEEIQDENEEQEENINNDNKNYEQNNEDEYYDENENINNNNQYQIISPNMVQINSQKSNKQYQEIEPDKKINHNYYESRQIKNQKKDSYTNYNKKVIINQEQQYNEYNENNENNENNNNEEENEQEEINYEEKEEDLNPDDNMNSTELKKQETKFSSYFGDANNNYYESGKINENQLSEEKPDNNINRYDSFQISNDGGVVLGIQSETLCVPAEGENKEIDEIDEEENQEEGQYEENEEHEGEEQEHEGEEQEHEYEEVENGEQEEGVVEENEEEGQEDEGEMMEEGEYMEEEGNENYE